MPEKKSYIGPNEVIGVTILEDRVTPGKNPIVRVLYATVDLAPGSIEVMPQRTFELLVTPEPKDWNWLRETQARKIQEELAAVILEWDVQYADIKAVVLDLVDKLLTAFDRATHFLWTGNDKTFISGKSPMEFLTLLQAEEILKKIEHGNSETTGEGVGNTAS